VAKVEAAIKFEEAHRANQERELLQARQEAADLLILEKERRAAEAFEANKEAVRVERIRIEAEAAAKRLESDRKAAAKAKAIREQEEDERVDLERVKEV